MVIVTAEEAILVSAKSPTVESALILVKPQVAATILAVVIEVRTQ